MNEKFVLILSVYLILINIAGFLSMGLDKYFAKNHMYRISEKSLFLTAILGGSAGSVLGMHLFRHKTKHWYFLVFMPLILLIQILLVIMVFC